MEFDGGDVSLVSSSWLVGKDRCYWPRCDQRKLARKHAIVKSDWQLFCCKILTMSGTWNTVGAAELN